MFVDVQYCLKEIIADEVVKIMHHLKFKRDCRDELMYGVGP